MDTIRLLLDVTTSDDQAAAIIVAAVNAKVINEVEADFLGNFSGIQWRTWLGRKFRSVNLLEA